jgi:hypothetical protein
MKIINNFLKKEEFKKIQLMFFDQFFPWYIQDGVNLSNDGHRQFCHTFFAPKLYVNSPYFNLIVPILEKLKIKSLIRIKANLIYKSSKIIEHGYHTDFNYENTTAIFYINTNNGYTKFKNKKICKSEENKLVYFDSKLEHTGSTCTDEDFRIVLNLNYF